MMAQEVTEELAADWSARLRSAGLKNPELLSVTHSPEHFGNAMATFRVGIMLLQIVRDREQELLGVAFGSKPDQFYPIDDIEIGMGWKMIEDVNSRRGLEQLDSILSRLALQFDDLTESMSGDRECLTRARFERAARDRGQDFINRLNA